MLARVDGKLKVVDDYVIDEDKFKKEQFNFIKNFKFDDFAFNWYILARKNNSDYELYRNVLEHRNLKQTYERILQNTKKQGNWQMEYEQLLNIYLSKKFNRYVLKPMCEKAMASKKYSRKSH